MNSSHRSDIELLTQGLHEPLDIDELRWERVLRIARASGLHARLAAANLNKAPLTDVVRRHLLSSARIAAYRTQMVRAELFHLGALCGSDFPVLVLKGGAYILQRRRMAEGRFVSDVDLLVPIEHLGTMEVRLQEAGWQVMQLDSYDDRYYRDWSHETPPMRFPGRSLEVDLHHAITPVTGSLAFDPAPLFERSEPVPGTPFRVLCAEDQVLHACLHCFHDGELDLRLREVADIDGLLREFAERPSFWDHLFQRAIELGLERPLQYGLRYARTWLGFQMPADVIGQLQLLPVLNQLVMDVLVPLSMFPSDPDAPPPVLVRYARTLMRVRYHLLRMPLHILLPHLARKSYRQLHARITKMQKTPVDGMP